MWWEVPAPTPCADTRLQALERQKQLTKPPGSLGLLETLAVDLASLQGRSQPRIERTDVRIFAADHGIAAQGVSAFPQSVTVQMIQNFAAGGAAIAVLAREQGATFSVVNLGTVAALPAMDNVVNRVLGPGTGDFSQGPAMTAEQLVSALQAGAETVNADADVFLGGEMGIGNTTSAAALASALLDIPVADTVGLGTGIDETGLAHKQAVVERALALHLTAIGSQDKSEAWYAQEWLRRLGGFEIAALAGAYIAAAQRGVPALVDGFICSVAALMACRMNASVRPWLLFAHRSCEPGHRFVLDALEAEPLLDLRLRLGEGSGAALALPLLRSACALHAQMATFAEAGVATASNSNDDSLGT